MADDSRKYSAVALGAMVVLIGAVGAAIVLPFLPALLWATVLSILTFPLYVRWREGFGRLKRLNEERAADLAALMACAFTSVLILIPFLLIGAGLFLQFSGLVRDLSGQSLEEVMAGIDNSVRPLAQQFGAKDFSLTALVEQNRQQILGGLRQPIATFAGQAGYTVFTLCIAILTQYFMLRDGHRLYRPAVELMGLPQERSTAIMNRVAETVRAVFIGTVLVAVVQGSLAGIAYAWAGVPNALVLGVISVLLCIIPLLGAPVIYFPVGVSLLLQGDMMGAAKVLGVGILLVSQIDNVLKPFFIGGRAKLHPLAIFFSILGGVLLIGPIGVMAGPMTLTLLLALQEVVRERYSNPLSPNGE
jgi:predicted PurR-regulated permease PerM